MNFKIKKLNDFEGIFKVPGDKSISHRFAMLSAIAQGKSKAANFLFSEDCINTINCFRRLGVTHEIKGNELHTYGEGVEGLKDPQKPLYVGNSGTTIRLISGLLAGSNINCIINGDASICKRPMRRIIEPLKLMGAKIFSQYDDGFAPLIIESADLKAIDYRMPMSSAQVKSCILFAGLSAKGHTKITENVNTRNHSELMIKEMGGNIFTENTGIFIQRSQLNPIETFIPGDISSAAFLITAALIVPKSEILIEDVGINKTRIEFINILKKMGAKIEVYENGRKQLEPMGTIKIVTSDLKGIMIEDVSQIIDEVPIIAVLAAFADGITEIHNGKELRIKESDRIKSIINNLRAMNIKVEEYDDGMVIHGNPDNVFSCEFESYNDHRIAMAFSCAALRSEGVSIVNNIDCISTSFPNFGEYFKGNIDKI